MMSGHAISLAVWLSSTRVPACTTTDAPLTGSVTLAPMSQTVFHVEASDMAGGSEALLGSAVSATDALIQLTVTWAV